MQHGSRNVGQEHGSGLGTPTKPPVRPAIRIPRGEVLARWVAGLRLARRYVENRQALGPMLVQIAPLDQLRAYRRVDREVRRRSKVKRAEEVARGDQYEVVFSRRQPNVRVVDLTVAHLP